MFFLVFVAMVIIAAEEIALFLKYCYSHCFLKRTSFVAFGYNLLPLLLCENNCCFSKLFSCGYLAEEFFCPFLVNREIPPMRHLTDL